MTLPIQALAERWHEAALLTAGLIGFAFGFVLERAGFGRSTKLAAQFYLYDMTVFKVMFGAIVTAMLGVVLASGLGLVDLGSLSAGAVSYTFIWPMLVGGLLLGIGFIISGYCPGTSLVGAASGHLDAVVTITGVGIGSVLYGEAFPVLGRFHTSGDKGQLFLYQWLGISPAWVAVGVAIIAVAAFIGAERVEKMMTARIAVAKDVVDEELRSAPRPRRVAFGVYAAVAVAVMVTLFVPVSSAARPDPVPPLPISATELAKRIVDEPWRVRVIDLRGAAACSKGKRIPGSSCTNAEELGQLGLAESPDHRDLVLVGEKAGSPLPSVPYAGRILVLQGGFSAWKAFALTPPPPLPAHANAEQRAAHQFRAALQAALSNQKLAPAAPAAPTKFVPRKRKKGGGCG
jgi:hypothetical protein